MYIVTYKRQLVRDVQYAYVHDEAEVSVGTAGPTLITETNQMLIDEGARVFETEQEAEQTAKDLEQFVEDIDNNENDDDDETLDFYYGVQDIEIIDLEYCRQMDEEYN